MNCTLRMVYYPAAHSLMSPHCTHLTLLEKSAALYPSSVVFQLPRIDPATSEAVDWDPVTYQQFHQDIQLSSKYWASVLQADGVPQRAIVGMWLGGMLYADIVHVYGVTRAGYIPHLFSLQLSSPDVVYELMEEAGASALIYDRSYATIVTNSPVPSHVATEIIEMDAHDEPLPILLPIEDGNELVFIFHTSGSTSGRPKLVPCSYSWLHSIIEKSGQLGKPKNMSRQDVMVWMGSVCNMGQTMLCLGVFQHGSCIIQPSKIAFSSAELISMVRKCGLNRLSQFATFQAIHIRKARRDPELLAVLQSMDDMFYTGLPLPPQEMDFGYENGLVLHECFANTECGPMLSSKNRKGDSRPPLRPMDGMSYSFLPLNASTESEVASVHDQESSSQLVELVVLSNSPDCPHISLRGPDGHYHTGDLFVEVVPGGYVPRGRDDDWIKSENSLRCDTKAIEDNVRLTCGHLVKDCVVVGSGRPSPVLFIEPADEHVDHTFLKAEVLSLTRGFHARRYLHERITSSDMIIVVPVMSLPRTTTKGNIRRRAVEELYKDQLDRVFCST